MPDATRGDPGSLPPAPAPPPATAPPPPRRWFGSVRLRATVAVAALFGVALTLGVLGFVHLVRDRLVEEVHTADRAALEHLARDLQASSTLPAVLPVPADRPSAQLQVVAPDGEVLAASASLAGTPSLLPVDQLATVTGPVTSGPRPVPTTPVPGGAPANRQPTPAGPLGARPPAQASGGQGQPGPAGPVGPVGAPAGRPAGTALPAPVAGVEDVRRGADLPGQPAPGSDWALTSVRSPSPYGPVTLVAATPLDDVQAGLTELTQALAVAIPVLVALIAAMAWVLVGRALRPVHAITDQADRITAANLHERVPMPGGDDEITHLARTMNAMLGRLEASTTRQRRFVSDASHELRSPVAAIRTEVEVALLHPDRADWAVVARNVLAEDERLDRIVTDLLLLARLDEDPGRARPTVEVDLDELVRAEAARTRRLPVDLTGVRPAKVPGRPEELARLVGHLLDNAARHGRHQVAVAVVPDGRRVVLTVDDDGAGIPPARRAEVFARFGRLEEARARDTGGAGLGLAVVRRIVQAHGGQVHVDEAPLGGARVVVELPAVPVP